MVCVNGVNPRKPRSFYTNFILYADLLKMNFIIV
jgi:hypothetical protein